MVEQYVESENKEIEIGFSAYFRNIWPPNIVRMPNDTCDVSFIRDFAFTTEFLAGKYCNVKCLEKTEGAGSLRVIERAFMFTKYQLILRYNDWLVL
jgi:hypothetical protein